MIGSTYTLLNIYYKCYICFFMAVFTLKAKFSLLTMSLTFIYTLPYLKKNEGNEVFYIFSPTFVYNFSSTSSKNYGGKKNIKTPFYSIIHVKRRLSRVIYFCFTFFGLFLNYDFKNYQLSLSYAY